jgi:organic radical activating enzyme
MNCKFLDHGIALAYQETVKPCCVWNFNSEYKQTHSINVVNLANWHQHKDLQNARELLAKDIWPENCINCKTIEEQGRQDSIRLGGEQSCADYTDKDITLEIRPGSVCNFACQTCWPAASSRVANFYKLADIKHDIDKTSLTSIDVDRSKSFKDFDFLLPIAQRLKSIIVLGGEPFYDKNCLSFLNWWQENTAAELIAFTNGSKLDFNFLNSLKNKLTLVVSLDAIDKPAEYIRFGTIWSEVLDNYLLARSMKHIDIRVNITTSVYNFYYLPELINFLLLDWPSVVTFGLSIEKHLNESVIPIQYREEIISRLKSTVELLKNSDVEEGQRWNAINAITSIITNLEQLPFDIDGHQKLKTFITKMDQVKQIKIEDYCPFVSKLIS